ncbi:MAG: hypothetical protein ACJ798_02780 [Phenylobacterium sp.]
MASPFDLTTGEVASFEGSLYRFTELAGPLRLCRFGDSSRGAQSRTGRFWLYASELKELLERSWSLKSLLKKASQRWAISDDWGDMELVWFMDIPRGVSIPAAWGAAKFQPKVSNKGQQGGSRQTRHSYEGGSIQLIVPVKDTDGREDGFLLSLVSGPIPVANLRANPDRLVR